MRPRPRSLRVRLALLYNGLLVAALIVFGVGGYALLAFQLRDSFDMDLVANVHHAADALGTDVGADGRLHPDPRFLAQLASSGGEIDLFEPDGTLFAASDPSRRPVVTGADLGAGRRHAHLVRATTLAGVSARLTVEPIHASDGTLAGLVSWAETTTALDSLLANVAIVLLAAGAVISVVALGAGWLVSRRALAPVAEATQAARAMAAVRDFGGRVPVGPAGDELAELSTAFNEMLAALAENRDTLQQFLADASHELRTPITTIRADLELATRPGLPDEERRVLCSEAKAEADRIGRLVADLLSLARTESGMELRHEPVELDEVLVESVRQIGRSDSVAVEIDALEPASVVGDRDRLKELCLILLENARTYTPAGRVVARLEVEGSTVRLTVVDTGIGIVPEDRERVFSRLYRGEIARRLRPDGSGLGLPIARWIVEAHDGSIELGETPGGGTTVSVTLPAVKHM